MATVIKPNEVGAPVGVPGRPAASVQAPKAPEQGVPTPPAANPVATPVATKKRSAFRNMKDDILDERGETVKNYILHDVIAPAVKSVLYDAVTGSMETMLYGERRSNKPKTGGSYVTYGSYSKPQPQKTYTQVNAAATSKAIDDMLFTERDQLDAVLDAMDDYISTYGYATVANLKEMTGQTVSYTDYYWGWEQEFIHMARSRRVREGWLLEIPPLKKIGG